MDTQGSYTEDALCGTDTLYDYVPSAEETQLLCIHPCDPTMDLMIEAKDKGQAVFELMKFELPGCDLFNVMIYHVREDENKPSVRLKRPKKERFHRLGSTLSFTHRPG
jgi:hypothetical protein